MEERKIMLKRIGIGVLFLFVVVLGGLYLKSKADAPATTLTVTNTVPDAGSATSVAEQTISAGTSPTNVGTAVVFQGTVSDANGDQWKLLVCKSTGTTGTDCDGGGSDRWCVSSSFVNSASQNTCNYTTQVGDAQSNDWYAYFCDATGCSSSYSQGTGSDGSESPFFVNHAPAFSVASAPTANPGGTFAFSTTSSDSDDNTAQDTISLYVCKANDFTGTACGAGGTWCSVTGVSGATGDASCNMSSVPIQDTTYAAYPFIIDSHNFASSGVAQGVNAPATVNNVAPTVSAAGISLNDTDLAGNLTLTAMDGTTSGFTVKFTAADDNGCLNSSAGNEFASATSKAYRSGVAGGSGCASNDNNCYAESGAGCTQDGGTCSGVSDTSADWTCAYQFTSFADSTVTGAITDSVYVSENWLSAVKVTDDDSVQSNSGSLTISSSGNEMSQFMAYDVEEAWIPYGSLAVDGTSSEQSTKIWNYGNTGINEKLSGTAMTRVPTGSIAATQQKYSASTGFDYDSAGTALTGSPVELALLMPKPTGYSTVSDFTYWKLKVPTGSPAGSYEGTNTIEGLVCVNTSW